MIIIANAIFTGFQSDISSKVFGFWGHIHITDIRVNRSIEPYPIRYNDSLKLLLKENLSFKQNNILHIQSFIITPGILSNHEYADGLFFKELELISIGQTLSNILKRVLRLLFQIA